MTRLVVCVAVGGVVVFGGCRRGSGQAGPAFEVERDYQRGPLRVVQRISETRIPLSGLLTVELELIIEDGFDVELPQVPRELDKFQLRDWKQVERRRVDASHTARRVRYRFEPLEPGAWYLPAFEATFRPAVVTGSPGGAGQASSGQPAPGGSADQSGATIAGVETSADKSGTLATEPFEITVVSLVDEQGGTLDIGPIDDVAEAPRSAWVYVGVATGVALAVAAGGFWWWQRRKRMAGPVRVLQSAHVIALGRLEAMAASGLIEAGRFEPFYAEVSGVLRHYIEDRFGLRAPEQTTEEFLAELRQTDVLDRETRAELGPFLERCDLIKFARQTATAEQMRKALGLVRRFVERTADDRYKVDVATGQRVVEIETEAA